MDRSAGAEALLDESWTTPWLDDGVFPYWPQAASMADLGEFLRWLSAQDKRRAELVFTHAKEFEKVHRLVTTEVTRSKQQHQQQVPDRDQRRLRESVSATVAVTRSRAGAGGAGGALHPHPLSAASREESKHHRGLRGGSGESRGGGRKLARSRSMEYPPSSSHPRRSVAEKATMLSDVSIGSGGSGGGGSSRGHSTMSIPGGRHSWPPLVAGTSPSEATPAHKSTLRNSRPNKTFAGASINTRSSRGGTDTGAGPTRMKAADKSSSSSPSSSPSSSSSASPKPASKSTAVAGVDAPTRTPPILVTPQPRRAVRPWTSSVGVGGADMMRGGGGAGGAKSLGVTTPAHQGRVQIVNSTWGTMATAAVATAAACRAAAFQQAEELAAAAAADEAASSARVSQAKAVGRGGGASPEKFFAGKAGSVVVQVLPAHRSSLSVSWNKSSGGYGSGGDGGAGGKWGNVGPPRSEQRKEARGYSYGSGGGGCWGGNSSGGWGGGGGGSTEDKATPTRRSLFEEPLSSPASLSWDREGGEAKQGGWTPLHAPLSAESKTSARAEPRRRLSPEQHASIQGCRSFLEKIDEEEKVEAVVAERGAGAKKEGNEDWICMRDPVSLREFWFDPETRAAEWVGGGAMEDVPGGMGLGLLSREERERLKGKFERRQQRGIRRAAGGGGGARWGGVRGVGLREQVLRKLTLEGAGSEDGRAQVEAVGTGVQRGAALGVFF